MKKKNAILIGGVILIVIIVLILYFIIIKNNRKDNVYTKEECMSIVGGGFTLKINKNNNEEVEEMSICIACSPDSYEKIENPTYDGYKFLGWYYDSEFNEKAEFDTTLDINPIPELDKNGCTIGYKTIEIFAKWEKI